MIGIDAIREYIPYNEQEEADKKQILYLYDLIGEDLFTRNDVAHFTSSCLIFNREHTKILMEYHNIYKCYSWCGGHNDGERDFLRVALQEAKEETGVDVTPIYETPIALDSLWVSPHLKKGKFVSSHLHLDLAYLFEADEDSILTVKEDEISDLKWFTLDEIREMEFDIKEVYLKMIERL